MGKAFTCAACGGSFVADWSEEEAAAEAAAAFTPDELADTEEVCETCWRQMREQMPDLDERYPPLAGDPA